jgi:hypothetical protein
MWANGGEEAVNGGLSLESQMGDLDHEAARGRINDKIQCSR